MLFLGDDWAEAHHDIELEDDSGRLLVRRRLPEGLAGIATLHELIAEHLDPDGEPDQVVVGIETERGPWVQALLAAGYVVFAINPLQVARYRERHSPSGAKSDSGDAHLLAEIVRLDRAHHRQIAGDSEIAEHVKIAARAHQTMIWSRVRQVNALRSLLREYYPAALAAFGTDLADRDALAVLAAAPSPEQGRWLSQARIESLLRRGGRQRNLAATAAKIKTALGSEQLSARPGVVPAYAASASALIAVLSTMVAQTEILAGQVEQGFGQHPDVEIYRSQPGLGVILGARVLAEFGDDPDRYADARSRKNYSGMSPITKASGTKRVVLARYARNRRLGDACSCRPTRRCASRPVPGLSTTANGPAAPLARLIHRVLAAATRAEGSSSRRESSTSRAGTAFCEGDTCRWREGINSDTQAIMGSTRSSAVAGSSRWWRTSQELWLLTPRHRHRVHGRPPTLSFPKNKVSTPWRISVDNPNGGQTGGQMAEKDLRFWLSVC